jgi:hypothetical protein
MAGQDRAIILRVSHSSEDARVFTPSRGCSEIRRVLAERPARRRSVRRASDQERRLSDQTVACRLTPDTLEGTHIQDYLLYLTRERHLAWSSVSVAASAIRFFYTQTLKRPDIATAIPPRRKPPSMGFYPPCEARRIKRSSLAERRRMGHGIPRIGHHPPPLSQRARTLSQHTVTARGARTDATHATDTAGTPARRPIDPRL